MTTSKDGDQDLFDDIGLTDDDFSQFVADSVIGLLAFLNSGDIFAGTASVAESDIV